MNSKEYERLRRQIEDRYREDLQALERIRELSNGTAPVREGSASPDGLSEKVKEAVQGLSDDAVFSKRTLTVQIRQADPTIPQSVQGAIGGILKRMFDAGEIKLYRRGKGKRASEYSKLNSPVLSPHDV